MKTNQFFLPMKVPTKTFQEKKLRTVKGRVEKFVDLCMEEYKCYEEGYVRLDEMAKILKEEAGVEIEGWH